MPESINQIPLERIDGSPATLGEYQGKVLLLVNVASQCGLTPQYEGLEKLYHDYRDKGFVVLGFPANNFGGQEPGTNKEIQEFCRTKFRVDFPMFSKISVKGDDQHPLYAVLTAAQPKATEKPDGILRDQLAKHGMAPTDETEVLWNFEKFVIDRNGKVVSRFSPEIAPDDPILVGALESAL